MTRFPLRAVCALVLALGLSATWASTTTVREDVVRAVMFYSPTCPHCHTVAENVIRPLMAEHGDRFQVIAINTATPNGQRLYQSAISHFQVPPQRRGVPTLVIGEKVLVGGGEIPAQLPGLVRTHLDQNGLDWPAIPGLAEALAPTMPQSPAAQPGPEAPTAPGPVDAATAGPTPASSPTPRPTSTAAPSLVTAPTAVGPAEAAPSPTAAAAPAEPAPLAEPTPVTPEIPGLTLEDATWQERFTQDPLGNGLAVGVLVLLAVSVIFQGLALRRVTAGPPSGRWDWAIPPLVGLGLLVAGYLAYVETLDVAAVCGPVGDCNAVQQSEYATLFGFLPMAVLGLLGYLTIGTAWIVARRIRTPWSELAWLGMGGAVWFGILFSIYLTFLEPFVIGATCMWCLTSALVMTLLLWIVTPRLRPALATLAAGRAPGPKKKTKR